MEKKVELLRPKKGRPHPYIFLFTIILLALTFALITAFVVGRAVIADGQSEDFKIELYEVMSQSHLGWLADIIFGEDTPEYPSILPPAVNSEPGKVTPLFAGSENASIQKITLTEKADGCNGVMLAISDPTKLFVGKSTQGSNVLSEIMNVERATVAFTFADAKNGGGKVLFSDGEWAVGDGTDRHGYFGFSANGIMHFGRGTHPQIAELSFEYATEQTVHSLIVGGVPCDFESTKGAIGIPSLSVAQCHDGSALLLFLDGSASCRDITELLYRYSAVNAAIIYTGELVGFITEDETVSFGEGFDSAEYASAWMIK